MTRLIPHFTSREAADLYKSLVVDTLKSIHALSPAVRLLAAYQAHGKSTDLSWLDLKNPPEFFRQDGKCLGERIIHTFGVAFGKGARQVVLIGADSPTLPTSTIQMAFEALEKADVVLGPSSDGGYYLIGLSRPCLRLFDDVTWSTDQVFERTVRNAQQQGYQLRVLPAHYHIETLSDVARLIRELAQDKTLAPVTRKYLETLFKAKPLLTTVA